MNAAEVKYLMVRHLVEWGECQRPGSVYCLASDYAGAAFVVLSVAVRMASLILPWFATVTPTLDHCWE